MSMTVAVTRNVPDRFNGFLASCMLEVAPGVYAFPRMRKAIRERLWSVLIEWSELLPPDGGVALFWRDPKAPSGMAMRLIGWPKTEFIEHEGVWLTIKPLNDSDELDELRRLAALGESDEPESDAVSALDPGRIDSRDPES